MGNMLDFINCGLNLTPGMTDLHKISQTGVDLENKRRFAVPKLVLAEIFARVAVSDLSRCSRVCKVWLQIFLETFVWKAKMRKECPQVYEELISRQDVVWRLAFRKLLTEPQVWWFSPVSQI